MSKFFRTFLLCIFLTVTLAVSAHATADTLKVGLYYGSSALYSANLQNQQGSGYAIGWFDETTRQFNTVATLSEEKISMTADSNIYLNGSSYSSSSTGQSGKVIGGYHIQLNEVFSTFREAQHVADQLPDGFVAYLNNTYRVRLGQYSSTSEANAALATYSSATWQDLGGGTHNLRGSVSAPSSTGVVITVTGTDQILFAFDCSAVRSLGIMPQNTEGDAVTWFKGYKWYGGFEYRRTSGGNLSVINVVNIDDYVKGVLPYEMSPTWPIEALKAQAVCARTYALVQTKHSSFDVCSTTDCQVYRGLNQASDLTDQAAQETAGIVATYNGKYAETYYYSSNGGASESSINVWSTDLPYLVGKEDPYEGTTTIPSYTYTETFTFAQLTTLLQNKGYQIGTVNGAYVSKTTPTGNVYEVTFTDTSGNSLRITKETCRTIFSTSLFGTAKSVKSMRFTISGGTSTAASYSVTGGGTLSGLDGVYAISGTGETSALTGGETYVITSSGTSKLEQGTRSGSSDGITITGSGSGHNVGMSQYGAKAMAELGYSYADILTFYFTGITLESA